MVRRGRPDVDVARDVVRTKIYDVRGKRQKHRRLNLSGFLCWVLGMTRIQICFNRPASEQEIGNLSGILFPKNGGF